MFIQTENTPNPNTIKFIPGEEVLANKTANFINIEQAKNSPLAISLFNINGVEAVFLGSDFISVTKSLDNDWDLVKTEILTTIMDHYVAKKPVMLDENEVNSLNEQKNDGGEDSELVKQIKELLDTRIRPSVAMDGGDIVFHGFEDGIVKLEMHGACSGCPSSAITLKNGIENMLKHYVPEVESVEAVDA